MFSDTSLFDIKEQVDILLKAAFGFPSTSDTLPWYLETNVKFNNYLFGEEVFLNEITSTPVFNGSGVKTLQQSGYGLTISDFVDFSDNSNDPDKCSIVDDTTGNVRRFQNLILDPCPGFVGSEQFGDSWFKFDNSLNKNILSDTLQFNYKQYTDSTGAPKQPYVYILSSQQAITRSLNFAKIPAGSDGGNWYFDYKSGILLFLDSENLKDGDQSYNIKLQDSTSNFTNKPVFTFYKYIGKKGLSKLGDDIKKIEDQLQNLDITINVSNIDVSTIITNRIDDRIINVGISIENLELDLFTQNILVKSDINTNRADIEYNKTKINFVENDYKNLNNKYNKVNKLCIDLSNVIEHDLSYSNLVFMDSDVLNTLYNENSYLKSDILIANSDINYYKTKLEIMDDKLNSITNNINDYNNKKIKNYNVYNLCLIFDPVLILSSNINEYNTLMLDHKSTFQAGFNNNNFFLNNVISFNNLEHLFQDAFNCIFIEFTCNFSLDIYDTNLSLNILDNLNYINFDLSAISDQDNIYGLQNINVGKYLYSYNNENKDLVYGPYIYKISNNRLYNKSIYYKNNYILRLTSAIECNVYNIKFTMKIKNYKMLENVENLTSSSTINDIYNLYLLYNSISIYDNSLNNDLNLLINNDLTFKNGFNNSNFFNNNIITFSNLENLYNNDTYYNGIFVEFNLIFSLDIYNVNINLDLLNNLNYINLDLSSVDISYLNNGLQKINVGKFLYNYSNDNKDIICGPFIYKISNNLLHNESIYYKNSYILIVNSSIDCNITDIKFIIQIKNYK